MITKERVSNSIKQSNYISRDLSWLRFNFRVLDQARKTELGVFEQMKFLAITASNLDEFFMIRVGSLYNYLDFGKERIDYSGLRESPFHKLLLQEAQYFFQQQNRVYREELMPQFSKNGFEILGIEQLSELEKKEVEDYFLKTVYPMLTPMVYDNYRTFPTLMNKALTLGIITQSPLDGEDDQKLSFVQIPQNLPRFYQFDRGSSLGFVPLEEIVRWKVHKLYRNVEILSKTLFRITRNGDITLEESEDMEDDFIDEVKRKLKSRKTGRVVRIEVEPHYSEWMMKILKRRWQIEDDNIFVADRLMDFNNLFEIVFHEEFTRHLNKQPEPVLPLGLDPSAPNLFELLKSKDILLHHPYISMEPMLSLIERAADDPNVLAIKMTIYRLAKNSRITRALQKAAENGKHVSVLFELKARFDEENNILEAERLQRAGCFVIHGISSYKTHTKLLLIVRKEEKGVVRYVHMSSGNYNESTARLYTDVSLMTTNELYAHDVSEFFNVITGHSNPFRYQNLITSPRDMRLQLIRLCIQEAENAQAGKRSGIVIKINSLEDRQFIDTLYMASQAGVPVRLIVRGICCLRPHRAGLSENIQIRSIVGAFLEHSRIFYFQNEDDPLIYAGSADAMVRSFDRRIESLFRVVDPLLKRQITGILHYNMKDNVNAYEMHEDGSYTKTTIVPGDEPFNIHEKFFECYANRKQPEHPDLFAPIDPAEIANRGSDTKASDSEENQSLPRLN